MNSELTPDDDTPADGDLGVIEAEIDPGQPGVETITEQDVAELEADLDYIEAHDRNGDGQVSILEASHGRLKSLTVSTRRGSARGGVLGAFSGVARRALGAEERAVESDADSTGESGTKTPGD
jgi:hypothetical protein